MLPSPLRGGRLVWVRVGKTDHPAFVVGGGVTESSDGGGGGSGSDLLGDRNPRSLATATSAATKTTTSTTTRIRWSSTGGIEDVPTSSIAWSLSPRIARGRSPPDDPFGSSRKRGGISRLSLSKRRRLNRERERQRRRRDEEEEEEMAAVALAAASAAVASVDDDGCPRDGGSLDVGDDGRLEGDDDCRVRTRVYGRAGGGDGPPGADADADSNSNANGGGPDDGDCRVPKSEDVHRGGRAFGAAADFDDDGRHGGQSGVGGMDAEIIVIDSDDSDDEGEDEGRKDEEDPAGSFRENNGGHEAAAAAEVSSARGNDEDDGGTDEDDGYRSSCSSSASSSSCGDRDDPDWRVEDDEDDHEGDDGREVEENNSAGGGKKKPTAAAATWTGTGTPPVVRGVPPSRDNEGSSSSDHHHPPSSSPTSLTGGGTTTDVICLLDDDDDGGNRGVTRASLDPLGKDVERMIGSELGAGGDRDDSRPIVERGARGSPDVHAGTTTKTTTTTVPESFSKNSTSTGASCPPPPPPPPPPLDRNEAVVAPGTKNAVTPSPSSDQPSTPVASRTAVREGRATATATSTSTSSPPPHHPSSIDVTASHHAREEPGDAAAAVVVAVTVAPGTSSAGEPHASLGTTDHKVALPRVADSDTAGGGGDGGRTSTPRIGSGARASRSSAYLLHLAEICHTVLGCGDDKRRWDGLFRWENGDDLSAVTALARFHVPHPSGPRGDDVLRKESPTDADTEDEDDDDDDKDEEDLFARAMLLYSRMFVRKGPWFRADDLLRYYTNAWRGGGGAGNGDDGRGYEGQSPRGEGETCTRCGDTSTSSSSGGGENGTLGGEVSEPRGWDEELCGSSAMSSSETLTPTTSRSLPPPTGPAAGGGDVHSSEGGEGSASSDGRTEDVHRGAPSAGRSSPPSPVEGAAAGGEEGVEEEDPLDALLADVDRLHSMGLVRTFRDETECAVIAGNDRYGYGWAGDGGGGGGILTADERRTVLRRLGGGSKRRASGGGGGGGSKQKGNPSRNQIVHQMRSQRSIVFSTKKGNDGGASPPSSGAPTLLPVRRHVRDVVLRSLRDKHTRYRGNDRQLSSPRRARSSQVGVVGTCDHRSLSGTKLEKTSHHQRLPQSKKRNVHLPPLCIRLREGPLIVLRRLCRLYLVAGNGPGQMRGGEAGWLSVEEREISPQDGRIGASLLPSYVSQLFRGSGGAWHHVQFPGLQHRLKIRSFDHVSNYHREMISQESSQRRCDGNDDDDAHSERGKRCGGAKDGRRSVLFVGGMTEFRTWEVAAEIRATVDRLMEMNELCHMMVRRRKKKKEEEESSQDPPPDGGGDDSGRGKTSYGDGGQRGNDADVVRGDEHPEDMLDVEDTYDLLTVEGRHSLVLKLLDGCGTFPGDDVVATRACRHVEEGLRELIAADGDASGIGVETEEDDVAVRGSGKKSSTEEDNCDRFENNAERIICAVAIVATEVLLVQIPSMGENELKHLIERPWLRHLRMESVLAHCVWDAVEIFEKRRYYGHAVRMLSTILGIHPNIAASIHRGDGQQKERHASSRRDDMIQEFVHALISRRSRGKAFERLVVDCTHLMRMAKKTNEKECNYRQTWMDSVSILLGGHRREFDGVTMSDTQHLCTSVISRVAQSGSVPFSFIRGFARRLKCPLAHTMVGVRNEEMSVLKVRLRNGEVANDEKISSRRLQNHEESSHSCSLDQDLKDTKLADHESMRHAEPSVAVPPRDEPSSGSRTGQVSSEERSRPITLIDDSDDEEALFEDKVGAGGKKRGTRHDASTCAVIGLKRMRRKNSKPDDKPKKAHGTEKRPNKGYRDWNPVTDFSVANSMNNDVGGRCSYVGWEDGGGKSIMNRSLNVEELALEEYHSGRLPKDNVRGLAGGGWIGWHDEGGHVRALFRILCSTFLFGCSHRSPMGPSSVFLTPYQSAPLDLHVGHARASCGSSVKSFYFRRKEHIEEFLAELEALSDAELCDLVHRRITENISKSKDFTRDTLLTRDASELRTLSMIAAGFGGKMLATMFRCLLFDYRHYCGGMPDLLLARARYDEVEAHCAPELVDLGKWVGEAFDSDVASEGRIADLVKVLTERDDEFLGCTKSSDSSTSSAGLWKRDSRRAKLADNEGKRPEMSVPEKLTLAHNRRRVKVECMFVEVKSENDRLDGRQEDWLNILDAVGNARVCKFGSGRSRASACTKDGKNL